MATYSDPVAKAWTVNDAAGFGQGEIKGTELGNPNFTNKIVLECVLGENLLKNTERDWNPSFEEPTQEGGAPRDWWIIDPITGSEYIQGDPKGAYDGEDYVRIRNLDPLGGQQQCGQLVLAPNNYPQTLNLPLEPATRVN